jgi:hypothetical protein
LPTAPACLRASEVVALKVGDVDGQRMCCRSEFLLAMFIDYASGNMLKTRAKPSGAARRTVFACVAFEQHANGRMFVVYAGAFGVFLISANAAGVRRISQAAIGGAASAKTGALDC